MAFHANQKLELENLVGTLSVRNIFMRHCPTWKFKQQTSSSTRLQGCRAVRFEKSTHQIEIHETSDESTWVVCFRRGEQLKPADYLFQSSMPDVCVLERERNHQPQLRFSCSTRGKVSAREMDQFDFYSSVSSFYGQKVSVLALNCCSVPTEV